MALDAVRIDRVRTQVVLDIVRVGWGRTALRYERRRRKQNGRPVLDFGSLPDVKTRSHPTAERGVIRSTVSAFPVRWVASSAATKRSIAVTTTVSTTAGSLVVSSWWR